MEGSNTKVKSANPGWAQTEHNVNEQAATKIEYGAKPSVKLALIGMDGPNSKLFV